MQVGVAGMASACTGRHCVRLTCKWRIHHLQVGLMRACMGRCCIRLALKHQILCLQVSLTQSQLAKTLKLCNSRNAPPIPQLGRRGDLATIRGKLSGRDFYSVFLLAMVNQSLKKAEGSHSKRLPFHLFPGGGEPQQQKRGRSLKKGLSFHLSAGCN